MLRESPKSSNSVSTNTSTVSISLVDYLPSIIRLRESSHVFRLRYKVNKCLGRYKASMDSPYRLSVVWFRSSRRTWRSIEEWNWAFMFRRRAPVLTRWLDQPSIVYVGISRRATDLTSFRLTYHQWRIVKVDWHTCQRPPVPRTG